MPTRHLSWEHYYQDKVSRPLRTTCSELLYMNMTYLRQTLLSSGTDKGELLLNIDLFTTFNLCHNIQILSLINLTDC
jgi:hypothetical protein